MQVLTWDPLAGLTFFLICRFAPISRLQKILLLPNYYLFYEYGTVCRQYLVGVLCLIIACILFPAGGKSPWAFTFALVAASLASVYSLILAVALAASFWGRAAANFRSADHRKSSGAPLLPSFLILGAGMALAVYCMLPEPDTYYAPADGWHFGSSMESLIRLGCAFTNAHFLFPRPDGYFWIPAWLTSLSFWQYLGAGLALPLFAGTVFLLRGSTRALLFYLVGTIGILLFLHTKYLGFTRHVGFLFIAWLMALWLKKQSLAPERAPALAGGTTRGATVGLTVVLATQAVTGVCAAGLDYERAFSNGRAAAGEVMSRHLEKACIAVWPDSSGADVAGYLDRSVYFPESGRWGSFTRWDRLHNEGMTDAEALRLGGTGKRARATGAGPRPHALPGFAADPRARSPGRVPGRVGAVRRLFPLFPADSRFDPSHPMISIVFLLSILWLGLVLDEEFKVTNGDFPLRLAAAIILGCFWSTWLVYLLSWCSSGLHLWTIIDATGLILLFNIYAWKKWRRDFAWFQRLFTLNRAFWRVYFIFPTLITFFFLTGLWIVRDGSIHYHGNFTDLAYHMSTVTAFLEQSAFPPLNPQSAAAKLSYHFMADFYAAILCKGGFSLFYSLKVPMVMFAFSLSALLCHFFNLVLKQRRAAVIACILFLFGHIGVFNLFYGAIGYPVADEPLSLRSWSAIEEHLAYPYYNFLNVLVDFFEPQLPFLFGFPFALIVLLVLYRKFRGTSPSTKAAISSSARWRCCRCFTCTRSWCWRRSWACCCFPSGGPRAAQRPADAFTTVAPSSSSPCCSPARRSPCNSPSFFRRKRRPGFPASMSPTASTTSRRFQISCTPSACGIGFGPPGCPLSWA